MTDAERITQLEAERNRAEADNARLRERQHVLAAIEVVLRGAAGPMICWETPVEQIQFILDDRESLRNQLAAKEARIQELEEESRQWEKESLCKLIAERDTLQCEVARVQGIAEEQRLREFKLVEKYKKLEADYQRIIREVLACNPLPASSRPNDDQLEPPWEVIARLRTELEQAKAQYGDLAKLAEGLPKYCDAKVDNALKAAVVGTGYFTEADADALAKLLAWRKEQG